MRGVVEGVTDPLRAFTAGVTAADHGPGGIRRERGDGEGVIGGRSTVLLQMQVEECGCGRNAWREVLLLIEKGVRRFFDEGEAGGNAEAQHVTAEVVGVGAGVVEFAGHEQERRIGRVDVMTGGGEGVAGGGGALGVAQEGPVVRVLGLQ